MAFGRGVFFGNDADDYKLYLEGYQGDWKVSHVMLVPEPPK